MPTKPTRTIRTRLSSRRIALIYLAVGVVWILATGIWVRSHSSASHDAFTFELIKGIAFVGGTALLLLVPRREMVLGMVTRCGGAAPSKA